MKRLFSIGLTLLLVLSMGMVAFASDSSVEPKVLEDSISVKIDKVVTVNNEGTVNPGETFSFNVGAGSGVRDDVAIVAPAFDSTTFTIGVAEGETTGTVNIDLPVFTEVGVYTYPITEATGNTAGMTYDTAPYNLVVTIVNNPEGEGFLRVLTLTEGNNVKTDAINNSFDAGNLTINKVITGNFADPNDEFEVTVTVTPKSGKEISANPIVWNTNDVDVENGVYTAVYSLKGGDSVTIKNLPYDVDYTVVETDSGEYTPSYDDNSDREFNAAAIETTITNNRGTEVNTGVNLSSIPYFLVLGLAGAGLIGFTVRRRFTTND